MTEKQICGAKNRQGEPCRCPPMQNGRCYRHGGKSTGAPKGNKNAKKHGIYSKFFSDDEKALLDEMALDNVDNELQFCKIQLIRVLRLDEPIESVAIIDRLMGRIQSLTQLRLDLRAKTLDVELKQLELAKIKEPQEEYVQPVKVVVQVEDARKYPSNDNSVTDGVTTSNAKSNDQ